MKAKFKIGERVREGETKYRIKDVVIMDNNHFVYLVGKGLWKAECFLEKYMIKRGTV